MAAAAPVVIVVVECGALVTPGDADDIGDGLTMTCIQESVRRDVDDSAMRSCKTVQMSHPANASTCMPKMSKLIGPAWGVGSSGEAY